MLPVSSLRAQRRNPYYDSASELPRRCVPRNDEFLRAFAPSRDTTFLFSSREAAKARRIKLSFGVKTLALALLPFSLAACEQSADWKGWVYTNGAVLTDDIPIGAYPSLEECRKSARTILDRLNTYEDGEKIPGDYECGLKCKADGGLGGLNVCEKTER